jgi:NADH-ubiquinone oxidoreductase chain 5
VLQLPITYTAFFLASLSLKAFPFFTGFYSKDYLITLLLVPYSTTATVAYVKTLAGALFTSLYSIRIKKITFLASPNYAPSLPTYVSDSGFFTSFPLILLSSFAVAFGYLAQYLYLDKGLDSYLNSIFIHPANNIVLNGALSEFTSLKLIPLLLLALFILLIIRMPWGSTPHIISQISNVSNQKPEATSPHPSAKIYFLGVFNFYDVFISYFIAGYYTLSLYIYRYLDKGLLELIGPFGLSRFTHFLGFFFELASTSFVIHYFYLIILFLITLILFSFLPFFTLILFFYILLT